MVLPVLYSFRRCPYAMRARLAVKRSGVAVELREVVLRDKPAEMIACSPKATVPVLVLANGSVIDESYDIMNWALAQNDPDGWLQVAPEALDSLVAWNDLEFKSNLDQYKYAEQHPGRTAVEYRTDGEQFLQELDRRLQSSSCLLSESLSIADMAIVPFVRQFANVDADWFASSSYRALRAWLKRITQSELFESIMDKYPAWKAGDSPTVLD
jgi:glutathione S-transferase